MVTADRWNDNAHGPLDCTRRVDCDHDGEEHQGIEGVKELYQTVTFGCVVTFLARFLAMRNLCIS